MAFVRASASSATHRLQSFRRPRNALGSMRETRTCTEARSAPRILRPRRARRADALREPLTLLLPGQQVGEKRPASRQTGAMTARMVVYGVRSGCSETLTVFSHSPERRQHVWKYRRTRPSTRRDLRSGHSLREITPCSWPRRSHSRARRRVARLRPPQRIGLGSARVSKAQSAPYVSERPACHAP